MEIIGKVDENVYDIDSAFQTQAITAEQAAQTVVKYLQEPENETIRNQLYGSHIQSSLSDKNFSGSAICTDAQNFPTEKHFSMSFTQKSPHFKSFPPEAEMDSVEKQLVEEKSFWVTQVLNEREKSEKKL